MSQSEINSLYASARSDSFSKLSRVISPSSRFLAFSIACWATPFLYPRLSSAERASLITASSAAVLTGTVTYIIDKNSSNTINNKVAIFIIQCTLKLYRKVKIFFCHTYFCKRNPMMRLYHILP